MAAGMLGLPPNLCNQAHKGRRRLMLGCDGPSTSMPGMSLPHALLTSLLERPGAGSELADRFDRSIGYFWHATHQQIYRELARLEDAGWVSSKPEPGARGRKRIYRILPAGRRELKRWIAEGEEPRPIRDGLMVRLRAAAAVGDDAGDGVHAELERRLAFHQHKLALYREIETRDFPGRDIDRRQELQHLVLTAGIMHETFWIEFSRKALRALSKTPA